MKLVSVEVPDNHAYLLPIGDIHFGDKAFGKVGKQKLQGYLAWVKANKNARIFLMGDLLNVASRHSKTSPFDSNTDEYQDIVKFFEPFKSQIIGGISGNHEDRMTDMFGFNPLIPFCAVLGIPFLGFSAVIRFRVGKKPKQDEYYQTYYLYAHHTTGGGGTLGGALNRKVKLQELVQGVDAYMGGHTHQLAVGFRSVFSPGTNEIVERKIAYIDTGSFLDWQGSYAEAKQMPPGKLGAPRIRLSGTRHHHDLHVSL
ncbi:MAG: metallophosphoesterase [Candidatus Hydrogenedentales bacterium]|jgi:hypothetical protein